MSHINRSFLAHPHFSLWTTIERATWSRISWATTEQWLWRRRKVSQLWPSSRKTPWTNSSSLHLTGEDITTIFHRICCLHRFVKHILIQPTNNFVCVSADIAQFRLDFDEIDAQVIAVHKNANENDPPVNYRQHISGGCYVSVTTGFKCVDFRQFYMPYGKTEVKPTRKGIALRLTEWDQMK